MSLNTMQLIGGYFLATTKAVGILFQAQLHGHVLIQVYSAIDTCGLLDAPTPQTSASAVSFKNWAKKYLLPYPGIEFNEVDLWAARCAVLHTFTSESDLSKGGQARELQYYTGDKLSPHVQHFVSFTNGYEGGKHLAVHYGDLCEAFFSAFKAFVPVLEANCASSPPHSERLRNILQVHTFPATAP